MAQESQHNFVDNLKNEEKFKKYFNDSIVLDVGSLDVNGNNRGYFTNCDYVGLDVGEGPNVDVVHFAHEFIPSLHLHYNDFQHHSKLIEHFARGKEVKPIDQIFDTIISTEAFEHDPYLKQTLNHIINDLLKPGGLFVFTCASGDQPEHGTSRTSPQDCPLMVARGHEYYKNLFEADIRVCGDIEAAFSEFEFINVWRGLQFWGIKR